MCNLCGMYLPDNVKFDRSLRDLLINIQIVASATHYEGFGFFAQGFNKIYSERTPNAAIYAAGKSSFFQLPEDVRWVITHTRKISSGNNEPGKDREAYWKNRETFAHPFIKNNVVVAHNGTLHTNEPHEMDSEYFASLLDKELESNVIVPALENTFKHFDKGLYSMLIAVKVEDNLWWPHVIKGNKPLNRWVCEHCGVVIYVTDNSFLKQQVLINSARSNHYWKESPLLLKEGVYNPLEEEPFHKAKFVDNYTTTYASTPWVGREVKSSKVLTQAKGKVKEFLQANDTALVAELIQIAAFSITAANQDKVLDMGEDELVTLLTLIKENLKANDLKDQINSLLGGL